MAARLLEDQHASLVSILLDAWAILAWLDGEEPALSVVNASRADRPIVLIGKPGGGLPPGRA